MIRQEKATVCAGIIFHEGKILIGRRSYGLTTKNLWEFPGGKIEPGETPAECVVRECMEELHITPTVEREFDRAFYAYPDRDLDFIFMICTLKDPEQVSCIQSIHSELAWVAPNELASYEFCPADKDVIEKLIKTYA